MKEVIASLQNPRIKHLRKLLEKSSERQKEGLFVVEGRRETSLALSAGIDFQQVFYCPELADPVFLQRFGNEQLCPVSRNVFGKLAYREGSDGLIALARVPVRPLEDLAFTRPNPLVIVLEAVEKPGNLGAILRTADAAGVDAVIVCDPKTDIYNPNVIRSSLGCVFTVPLRTASTAAVLDFLRARGIRSYAAALTATAAYHETDFRGPSAIVMGSEAWGLSRDWLENANQGILIPMRGKIDSLNVSASCAIIVFEAMRQRNFRD